ncbi:MAG: NADH-quinone oxidoreductase subunit NuoE [Tissierellia bacterium]|nr:NADH-quinone oxidoreductase subunit NuoE [Tissierellia bacterium]
MALSREEINKFDDISDYIYKNDRDPSELIEVLHKTQELYGYIPEEIVPIISQQLRIPVSQIYGVVTFYSRFSFIPKGKYAISVCMGTACYVKGAQDILEEFSKELEIKTGETTEDLLFSIIETRCIGDCALAPVVTVNDEVYAHFDKKDVKKLLDDIREREEN